MATDPLLTLASQAEAATVEQQREMLDMAWDALNTGPKAPGSVSRFERLLDAEAYLDAAAMLRPEGWFLVYDDLGADGRPLAVLLTPIGMRKVIGAAYNQVLSALAANLRAHHANRETEQ